ncbi:rhomboid family intramembrane serine protease [Candidatus Haliotispira prima]|uniref:Rhomboid family intramembrane serine protease n=1 Tax=Candidatus Haliotispira prima TaxID=3034016 RepID=A0ABY8MJZ7_9SPIO|nr:rhomboid family intramembrane serine protease [Candidatus Haliotispira prima]
MALKIRYNAPVTLTFSLICTLFLLADQYLGTGFSTDYFVVYGKNGFSWDDKGQYYRLISYVLGHRDWNHLMGNLTYILLLGPILEERFGSFRLALMILITAFVPGFINVSYYDSALIGASGIVFMMITLISIVNIRRNEIPLTLILMAGLYLTREIIGLFANDSVSQIAHISGGIMGIILGFLISPKLQVKLLQQAGQKGQVSGQRKGGKGGKGSGNGHID